ncbi:MAG TPA: hypothetical protein VGC76_16200 [Pyrinomonadaceae bacterium]|jgi:hypothetical protein
MKVRFCSLLLVSVLTFAGFTTSGFAVDVKDARVNSPEFNVVAAGYLFLPKTNTEWCSVSLSNPNSSLNVRNGNGKVVGKLKHGTSVYVDTYDGGFARVSVKRRGRLVILGWVATEFLEC